MACRGWIAIVAVAGIAAGQKTPDRGRLIAQLESSDPVSRADAFEQLNREREVFAAPGMSDVLLRALDRENQLIYSALRESHGASGVSQKYGEGFAEYTAILLQTCLRYCDLGNPATIKVLMTGPYYGEGEFAERVAPDHGVQILPQMLAEARDAPYGRQIQAVSMLGSIARLSRTLSSAQRRAVDSALVAAARLPSETVPEFALHAMMTVLQSAGAALGKRIKFGGPASASLWFQVVGVAADTRYRDLAATRPVVYVAWAQRPTLALSLIIARGKAGQSLPLSEIRQVMATIGLHATVTSVARVETLESRVLASPRFNTLVVGAFAAIAVLIAALGVYALMSTFVRQRIPELGVRLALGAEPNDVLCLVLGRGLALVAMGVGCGVVLSFAGTRLLQGMLYDTSPVDPLTIFSATSLTAVIATIACYGPARKAARTDPLLALKSE
jgi:hypothetical protein